ncbi:MAG TPA: acyltransferase [Steroidobacteraceae bacterium]|nr:acyltransferase [Steroidobacteraceae bacterium]
MALMSALRSGLPAGVRTLLRPHVQRLRTAWRRVSYAWRFFGLRVRVHPTAWVASRAIIRCTGGGEITIGPFCEIHDYAMIDSFGGSVQLGANCSLNPFAIIYGHGGTRIGDGVRIAAHVVIIPANHNFRSDQPLHEAGVHGAGISIGDDVWLGSGARVLDGVTIGSRSVVGAGAVVTRTVAPGCIALGVPARIRSIDAAGGS